MTSQDPRVLALERILQGQAPPSQDGGSASGGSGATAAAQLLAEQLGLTAQSQGATAGAVASLANHIDTLVLAVFLAYGLTGDDIANAPRTDADYDLSTVRQVQPDAGATVELDLTKALNGRAARAGELANLGSQQLELVEIKLRPDGTEDYRATTYYLPVGAVRPIDGPTWKFLVTAPAAGAGWLQARFR